MSKLPDPADRDIIRTFLTKCKFPQRRHCKSFDDEPTEHLRHRLDRHISFALLLNPHNNEIDLIKEGFYIENIYGGIKFIGLVVAFFPKLTQFQVEK
jgi:hypothetical protein